MTNNINNFNLHFFLTSYWFYCILQLSIIMINCFSFILEKFLKIYHTLDRPNKPSKIITKNKNKLSEGISISNPQPGSNPNDDDKDKDKKKEKTGHKRYPAVDSSNDQKILDFLKNVK